jgi:hypothetical protein
MADEKKMYVKQDKPQNLDIDQGKLRIEKLEEGVYRLHNAGGLGLQLSVEARGVNEFILRLRDAYS